MRRKKRYEKISADCQSIIQDLSRVGSESVTFGESHDIIGCQQSKPDQCNGSVQSNHVTDSHMIERDHCIKDYIDGK